MFTAEEAVDNEYNGFRWRRMSFCSVRWFQDERIEDRMLTAYIDDSGWDGRSPVFVLAGYISTTERWQTFSDEWQDVLSRPRSLQVLKMKYAIQLENRKSPFFGWTEKERDERLIEFTKVIKRNVMHGIVSVVPVDAYDRIFKGKYTLEALDRPYFLSFFGVMTALIHLTEQLGLSDKIEFVFDTHDRKEKEILERHYQQFVAMAPPQLRTIASGFPRFEKDEVALPLQAADMIAWHARRYYLDQFSGKDPTKEPSNVYFANLFEPEHDIFNVWTEEKLMEAARALYGISWSLRGGVRMTIPDPSRLEQ